MSTHVPAWADASLSAPMYARIARGESEDLEFKRELPKNMDAFAKEIAAFATSNTGIILVGVEKTGEVVGVADLESAQGRDSFRLRIEGTSGKSVKPPVLALVRFLWIEGKAVAAVEIEKGDQPLYYVGAVAYVRHGTQSRPAEPQEVIDCVLAWQQRRRGDDPETKAAIEYLSGLAALVVDVVVYTEELEDRNLNPWLDQLRWTFSSLAEQARELALRTSPQFTEASPVLDSMAADLDRAAHEQLAINYDDQMDTYAARAREYAVQLRKKWLDPIRKDSALDEDVRRNARKLTSLAARLEEMDDQNRMEDIQSAAGDIGLVLRKAAAFEYGLGGEEKRKQLAEIGRRLRNIEIEHIYSDGGESVRKVFEGIRAADRDLFTLVASMDGKEAAAVT